MCRAKIHFIEMGAIMTWSYSNSSAVTSFHNINKTVPWWYLPPLNAPTLQFRHLFLILRLQVSLRVQNMYYHVLSGVLHGLLASSRVIRVAHMDAFLGVSLAQALCGPNGKTHAVSK